MILNPELGPDRSKPSGSGKGRWCTVGAGRRSARSKISAWNLATKVIVRKFVGLLHVVLTATYSVIRPLRRLRRVVPAALIAAPLLAGIGCSCSHHSSESHSCPAPDSDSGPASQTWRHPNGNLLVEVSAEPFALTVKDAAGHILMESASGNCDPASPYAPLSITHNEPGSSPTLIAGWDSYRGADGPWQSSTRVTSFADDGLALVTHLATSGDKSVTVRIEPQGAGLRILATVDAPGENINRVSLAFKMHDDPTPGNAAGALPPMMGDHFFGFGERYVRADHRGQKLYTWVENGGLGQGEGTPPGPQNPIPNGEGMTYMPIPWFLSPRGFGVLLNGTFRTVNHLGDETADAWRIESWRSTLDATIFADPDPLTLIEDLTAITGRPPEIADWVLAPRRRADPGTDEPARLRAAHIPTSVIDLDVHYFPSGDGSDSQAMKALTSDMHTRGYKAVAYFNPYISDKWHPVFDQAASMGYLVKHADGTPYVVLVPPYSAAMIDFTNPDAVAWYQKWLQQALDDGWDGWMYDFGEYVPMDAVMANGMTGAEAHNLYPVLYQKAAFDLLQKQKPKNYLVFVRSGFLGTSGLVPMVWAGDQSTDFDRAAGLPAALTGALNAGMSGIPLWGSDISGFHFLFNPPPDKEVYLRWTELGAFSADMHDENAGVGGSDYTSADRWQIWKDQESQDVYRRYASYKTRMIPYVKLAVRQAQARGTPVMRHLYLLYPQDQNVYTISDEYMFGDSLLVAPVVTRGQTSRQVYLPEPAYFDFWSGQRVVGGRAIDVSAQLDAVPVFALRGAIVPLLHPDVETVVPSLDGSVVSAEDRADFLEVAVFAGGNSTVTLEDGTMLSQSAPNEPFTPTSPQRAAGSIPLAASEADLWTCDACAWDDPANHLWKVAVNTSSDTITAGPLTLSVQGSPAARHYLFSVRH